MARQENQALRMQLEMALRKNLCTVGLNATSYQMIADEVGVSRALVQHYYPQKMDFAVQFLHRLGQVAAEVLGIDQYAEGERLTNVDAFLIVCLYYEFLLSEPGTRQLLFDVLKDRELADELIAQHYQWGLDYIDPTRPSLRSRSKEAILAWGGFYELMYVSIQQDFAIDIPSALIPVFQTFLEGGDAQIDPEEALEAYRPDPSMLLKLKAAMECPIRYSQPAGPE